jgi:hypothetical protein
MEEEPEKIPFAVAAEAHAAHRRGGRNLGARQYSFSGTGFQGLVFRGTGSPLAMRWQVSEGGERRATGRQFETARPGSCDYLVSAAAFLCSAKTCG